MSYTFYVVYSILQWASNITGLSYEAINVIVYYIFMPFIFCLLADKALRKPIITPLFSVVIILVLSFTKNWNYLFHDIFYISVDFLMLFSYLGINYDFASVLICVIAPILVFVILFIYAFPDISRKILPSFSRVLLGIRNK